MTLDEAIEHAEWCAENSCGECADEHRQLAEWLRELKDLRRKREILKAHGVEIVDAVAGGYEVYNEAQRTIDRLKGEDERLREIAWEMLGVINSSECSRVCRHWDGCRQECVFRVQLSNIEAEGNLCRTFSATTTSACS